MDFATDPCTSKWKTDLAVPARTSASRRQRGLPDRVAPLPTLPSRTIRHRCGSHRLANGTGSRRGTPANQVAGGGSQNTAAETRSRGQCRPVSAGLLKAARLAIWRRRVTSSIFADSGAVAPRLATMIDLPYRSANPLGSMSAFLHQNSRYRCTGRRPGC